MRSEIHNSNPQQNTALFSLLAAGVATMTKAGMISRNIYMRVTINGKRKYVNIGLISRSGKVTIFKGMPNPGWWEE